MVLMHSVLGCLMSFWVIETHFSDNSAQCYLEAIGVPKASLLKVSAGSFGAMQPRSIPAQ